MARARGPARRQLVARGRQGRRRAASEPRFDPAVVRRVVRWGVWIGGVVLAVVLVGPWCLRIARTHTYFAVREVVVRHVGRLGDDAVRALADVPVGMNVWDVDAEGTETRLLTNGWIRSAHVRRELPDRVVIHVRENRPVAILAVADEAPGLYYLAVTGRIFAPVGSDDTRDLPFVTGLGRADLAGTDAFGPRAVRRALALLRHADRVPHLGAVSELHVDREDGLTLLASRPALPIDIGWGDYDVKLARLAEVLPYWAGREHEVRSVSCVFEDEVIVRTRAQASQAGAKGGTTTRTGKGAGKSSATGA